MSRIREKVWLIYKATRQHARNLATFAFIFKATCFALRTGNNGKERSADTFLAGLLGGYYVFGRSKSSVNQQIVIYVAARVMLAAASLAIQPPGDNALIGSQYGGRGGMGILQISDTTRERIRRNAWPVFASVSWASVMWLFRYYPDMLQPSLRSSMTYMYVAVLSFVIALSVPWFFFCYSSLLCLPPLITHDKRRIPFLD